MPGISISILLLIVAFGTSLRLHNLTKQNLWIDEYRTLYLATGRGDSIYRLPLNQIIEHPPDVGFSGAPAWWHIWNGLNTTSHPPLYHIVLRLWVDLLGDHDESIRGMSDCFLPGLHRSDIRCRPKIERRQLASIDRGGANGVGPG